MDFMVTVRKSQTGLNDFHFHFVSRETPRLVCSLPLVGLHARGGDYSEIVSLPLLLISV